jgi:hypothetical protein
MVEEVRTRNLDWYLGNALLEAKWPKDMREL